MLVRPNSKKINIAFLFFARCAIAFAITHKPACPHDGRSPCCRNIPLIAPALGIDCMPTACAARNPSSSRFGRNLTGALGGLLGVNGALLAHGSEDDDVWNEVSTGTFDKWFR